LSYDTLIKYLAESNTEPGAGTFKSQMEYDLPFWPDKCCKQNWWWRISVVFITCLYAERRKLDTVIYQSSWPLKDWPAPI